MKRTRPGVLREIGKVPGLAPELWGREPRLRDYWPIQPRELRGRRTAVLGERDWRERQAWPREEPLLGRTGISLPQRRAIWWLINVARMEPGADFLIEVPIFGEYGEPLAVLPDVMIFTVHPGGVLCWEIQGERYHAKFWQRHRDQLRRQRLMMATIYGMPVADVIFVWERDINQSDDRRNEVCDLALKGIEIQW